MFPQSIFVRNTSVQDIKFFYGNMVLKSLSEDTFAKVMIPQDLEVIPRKQAQEDLINVD